jgi:tetratricopeptide (TPR) repeat protein
MYRQVLQGYQEICGLDHASTGEVCSILAELYEDLGQLDHAEEMASQAPQIFDKSLGSGDISTVEAAATLGLLYAKRSKLDMAELMWERAVRGFEEIKGPDHPSTLGQLHNLGRIYKMRSCLALSERLRGAMRALGPDDSLTQRIGQDLALLYEALGQMEEVMQVNERLRG